MIIFSENQLNHFRESTKIRKSEFVVSGISFNHLFIFNYILRNKKEKRYFIQLKANILNLQMLAFFL